MRKIFIFVLLIFLFLSGCVYSNKDNINSQDEVSVILPDEEIAATVNGYYIPPKENEIRYYGNIKSKKFHTKKCVWTSKTDEVNLKGFTNRQQAIDEGFNACKTCKP